ncbi:hypothetical protein Q7C_1954 [Methylophaga frappieri]|jgi:hypothetical protein|uniref:Uncharacterized protein n=1 Tax=Methylophaga frappieri (strain ATCC BAA-2434 / DSM 25690 / JAM7) TaxID=754477 RepID=I1YJK1_METFJ|nr:DUF6746 family protein [Methylophaga frappieri]AFJ03094.1 hypothetical protein Q7C_1954 [Methylophaga frappieri]
MNVFNYLAAAALSFGVADISRAQQSTQQLKSPVETFEQVVSQFNADNDRLKAILANDPLTASDVAEISVLTQALEIALNKINQQFVDPKNIALPVISTLPEERVTNKKG